MVKECSIKLKGKLSLLLPLSPACEAEVKIVMDPSEVEEILDIEVVKDYVRALMSTFSIPVKAVGLAKRIGMGIGKLLRRRNEDVDSSRDRSLLGSSRRSS